MIKMTTFSPTIVSATREELPTDGDVLCPDVSFYYRTLLDEMNAKMYLYEVSMNVSV